MNASTRSASKADALAGHLSPLRDFWRSFSTNKGALIGLVIVCLVLLLAAFAQQIAPYAPDLTDNAVFLVPPVWQSGGSSAHLLGTDAIGRDMLSRLIFGARLSLLIGVAVVSLSIVIGTVLGLLSGYIRGIFEVLVMRLMDIILTLPSLLLAIVIVAILGPGLINAMLAVAIVVLPHYVRITRAAVIAEAAWPRATIDGASVASSDAPLAATSAWTAAESVTPVVSPDGAMTLPPPPPETRLP